MRALVSFTSISNSGKVQLPGVAVLLVLLVAKRPSCGASLSLSVSVSALDVSSVANL